MYRFILANELPTARIAWLYHRSRLFRNACTMDDHSVLRHWSSVTLSSLLRGGFYCLWYLVSTRNHACRQGTYCDNFMIVFITMILIETLFLVDPENIVIPKLSILMNKFPTRLSDSKGCIYRFVDHFLSWFNVFSTLVLDHFFTHEFAPFNSRCSGYGGYMMVLCCQWRWKITLKDLLWI